MENPFDKLISGIKSTTTIFLTINIGHYNMRYIMFNFVSLQNIKTRVAQHATINFPIMKNILHNSY